MFQLLRLQLKNWHNIPCQCIENPTFVGFFFNINCNNYTGQNNIVYSGPKLNF
jgi:hypothetical protein